MSIAAAVLAIAAAAAAPNRSTLNVLHIVADDCRPEFGLYGSPNAVTPNLDALAARSTVFVNAFCQQPVCSPSRNSFMTALRPDSTGAWNFINYFRERRPSAVSFPQFFKQQPGYLGLGAGKLYHTTNPPNHDEPLSWSPAPNGSQTYYEPDWRKCAESRSPANRNASTFCVDDTLPYEEDGATAKACVAHLTRARHQDSGFYVGCGFHRPHAPYLIPAAAYAQLEHRPITLAAHPLMDPSVPDIAAIVNFGIGLENGTRYRWDPKAQAVPAEVQLAVRRHYFAAITWMDSLVGDLVTELDKLELTSSTIVIFHADHGYFQGESGEWEKKMLFENTARVPLIIHNPRDPVHRRTEALAELIDVYPTAVVLAGFEVPSGLDGISLAGVVRGQPGPGPAAPAQRFAFTQYPRCDGGDAGQIAKQTCLEVPERKFSFMGFSVRSADYRYTEWRAWLAGDLAANWTAAPVAVELYNETGHFADSPHAFDHQPINIAGRAALVPVQQELHLALRQQFAPGTATAATEVYA